MPRCSYCNQEYSKHKGLTIVDSKSGQVNNYCSSKCRKNAEMGRKKRKWALKEKAKSKQKQKKNKEKKSRKKRKSRKKGKSKKGKKGSKSKEKKSKKKGK